MESSKTPHSPHARVRVINVSEYDAQLKTKEQQLLRMSDEGCQTPTPRKRPAKITSMSKELAPPIPIPDTAVKDALPIPDPDEEALSDFLNRVAISQQQDAKKKQEIQALAQAQAQAAFSMLPEYARYQEARFQRALSRGNSLNNLCPPSPGVEWVDHRPSPQSLQLQRAWDANRDALVARHSFPANIFCDRREEFAGYPLPPPSPERVTFHDFVHRRSYQQQDNSERSIPSAAALSRGSSSSWSDEEEQRHFMDYMEYMSQGQAFAHHQHIQQQHHSAAAAAAAVEEESQEAPLVEISPGVHEPLRKADETVRAVRLDFYVPVSCFGCSQDIFCIADAKYVICPGCRVVSPLEEDAQWDGRPLRQHGLGLGFTCESLFQIQSDILQER